MKAIITKSKTTAAIIASIPTPPEDGRLCIRATDAGVFAVSETYTGVHIEPIAGVATEPGDTWLNGAKLAGIVKLADHDVVLEGCATINPTRHLVVSGRYRAKLADREGAKFGIVDLCPAQGSGSVDAAALRQAIAGVRSVAESKHAKTSGTDATKGVMFEAADGKLRVVCTDGHRMAVSEVAADLELATAVLVPEALRDLVSWLSHREGAVSVHVDDAMFWLLGGGAVFGHRLKSRAYLDWRRIWGAAMGKPGSVDAAALKQARQSFAGLEVETVRFSVDGGSATLKTIGSGDEAEVGAGGADGESGAVTLDPLYLAAANDLAAQDLRIAWPVNETSPVMFRGDVCAHLVMPKRA